MTPGYGISYTVWCSPTPGTILWPFKFEDGYISKEYVKVRYKDYDGNWYHVPVDKRAGFESDFELSIRPAIPPCLMVEIYRDTPKDYPIVVYGNGGRILAAESRSAAIRQSLHVVAELKELANRSDLVCLCKCRESPTLVQVTLTNQADLAKVTTSIMSIETVPPVYRQIDTDEQATVTTSWLSVTIGSPILGFDSSTLSTEVLSISMESVLVGSGHTYTEVSTIATSIVSITQGAEDHGTDRTAPDGGAIATSLVGIGLGYESHGTDRTAAEPYQMAPTLIHIGMLGEMHGTDKTPPDVATVSTAILQITRT